MAEKDSTTKNPEILERLKQDFVAIKDAMSLMDTVGGIAYQAMLAAHGNDLGQEGLKELLIKMESPWTPPSFQESIFQIILKLAGDAYSLLSECADPEYVLKKDVPAETVA